MTGGTETLPKEKWRASKGLQPMNWIQALEGTLDTTHPSWLHMWSGAQDIKDDGSDAPGVYTSGLAMWKFWWFDKAPRVEVIDAWHGFRGVGLRTTPKGHTHARLYQFVMPYTAGGGLWVVPMDDELTMTFSITTHNSLRRSEVVVGRRRELDFPGWPYAEDGLSRDLDNDWLIDREVQRAGTIYSGIAGSFNNQDVMATQTAFRDRRREHLGTLDRKIIRIRRLLLEAAKNLAKGLEPPALDPGLPYATVLGSELDPYMNPDTRTGSKPKPA
jgi:hypothetical protein